MGGGQLDTGYGGSRNRKIGGRRSMESSLIMGLGIGFCGDQRPRIWGGKGKEKRKKGW